MPSEIRLPAAAATYAAAYAANAWQLSGQMLTAMIDVDHAAVDRLLAKAEGGAS